MNIRAFSVLAFVASLPGWAQTTVYNQSPARAFGQAKLNLTSGSPNLVEGRELFSPQSIAFDRSVDPPIVYVADTSNHRVLAWKNANGFSKGDLATLAIGQIDLQTTRVGGPGTPSSIGLSSPTAVGVDANGNLYVVDTGNNRILRFAKPLSQGGDFPTPDMVIGQRSFTSGRDANQGSPIPSAKTIATNTGSGLFRTSIAFDRQGSLWFADSGNNRVIRYPAAALTPSNLEPEADFVLGQTTFATRTVPADFNRTTKTALSEPSGLAFSSDGDLYVSDRGVRVLYFKAPFSTFGQAAVRILGVVVGTQTDPNPRTGSGCPALPPQDCETTLGAVVTSGGSIPPEGVAVLGNNLFVADAGNSRIARYETPDRWPAECPPPPNGVCAQGTVFSPPISQYIGQIDGKSVKSNRGGRESSAISLSFPTALAFLGTDLYVADTGNHRVLVFPQTGGFYTAATRLLGQVDFPFSAPNLVEGKELYIYDGRAAAAMVVDTNSNPPRLYIADSFNNRILGFRDARNVGTTADIVIGQQDLLHTTANFATADPNSPTESTVNTPLGLAVASNGDLYVADSGNSRVLRFPRPFDQSGDRRANLVIGQNSFFTRITDASRTTMRTPAGVALTQAGHLLVSDNGLNRVLLFRKPEGGDFTNGMAATAVFGQPDFLTSSTGSDRTRLNSPRGIATDTSDRLYVADTGNNRVSVFTGVLSGETDPPARFTTGFNQPLAIAVSPRTGEIWVAETGNNRTLRFPFFEEWSLNPTVTLGVIPAVIPFAVALDASDNVLIAEATNRVSFYYIQAIYRNAASYSQRGLAPGMLAYIARLGPFFAPVGTSEQAQALPWPKTLADVQVLFNGTPSAIYRVTQDIVTFQVPSSTPVNTNAEVQVIRASTGEVLMAATFRVNVADPAFFTSNAQGFGQIAAVNEDGTVNTPANPIGIGKVISFFGTGAGVVPNQPPDGNASAGALPAETKPLVSIINPGTGPIPVANVLYFGLAPGLPGLWQLNILVPANLVPTAAATIAIVFRDFNSNEGPSGRIVTTFAIK